MAKKLGGIDSHSQYWVTNVGNEFGQVLQSVVVGREDVKAVKPMIDGL